MQTYLFSSNSSYLARFTRKLSFSRLLLKGGQYFRSWTKTRVKMTTNRMSKVKLDSGFS